MIEDNSDKLIEIILSILGGLLIIVYSLSQSSKNKIIKNDIDEFIKENNYQRIDPNIDELNELIFPITKKEITLSNCFEIPEDHWNVIWGDCSIRIPSKGRNNSSCIAGSFFMFKFTNKNLYIPYFYLRDNQGAITEGIKGSWTYNNTKVINNLLSKSYFLEEPYIEDDKDPIIDELKDFFTDDVVNSLLEMDKYHMPEERNMTLSDFSEFYSLAKVGVRFWGENDTLFVLVNKHKSLKKRQELFILAAEIADAIVKQASDSNLEEPDE